MLENWTVLNLVAALCSIGVLCLLLGFALGFGLSKPKRQPKFPDFTQHQSAGGFHANDDKDYMVIMLRDGQVIRVNKESALTCSGSSYLTSDKFHGPCMVAHVTAKNKKEAVSRADRKREQFIVSGEWAA